MSVPPRPPLSVSPFLTYVSSALYLDVIAPCLTLTEQAHFAVTHKWAAKSVAKASPSEVTHHSGTVKTVSIAAAAVSESSCPHSSIHEVCDRLLLRSCVRALLFIPAFEVSPESFVKFDGSTAFYSYPANHSALNLRAGFVEWPQHSSLAFWRRGPGFRASHMSPVGASEKYFVFEPDQMQITRGIWHPTLLAQAMDPTITSTGDHTADSLASAWLQRRADLKSALIKMAEMDWIDPDEACCGVGDATGIADTAAIQELPAEELHQHCTAKSSQAVIHQSLSHVYRPIAMWSTSERRNFLLAWERMASVQVALRYSGARAMPLLQAGQSLDQLRNSDDALIPLPFLLPWPAAGSEEDKERTDAMVANRTSQRWNSDEKGCITPEDYLPWRNTNVISSPYFNGSGSVSDLESVSLLSSVVRGCPWPLDCDANGPLSRMRQEQLVVARRVVSSLHVDNKCSGVIHAYAETYWPGRRPLGETVADGRCEEAAESSAVAASCHYPLSVLLESRDGPLRTYDARILSTCLPSSFLFSFGSEHLMPWPLVLVAPIAPGWIGGIIMATNTFERRSK